MKPLHLNSSMFYSAARCLCGNLPQNHPVRDDDRETRTSAQSEAEKETSKSSGWTVEVELLSGSCWCLQTRKLKGINMDSAPQELSLVEIRNFMLRNNCKVTNHALVKHFRAFLTNKETQGKCDSSIVGKKNCFASLSATCCFEVIVFAWISKFGWVCHLILSGRQSFDN